MLKRKASKPTKGKQNKPTLGNNKWNTRNPEISNNELKGTKLNMEQWGIHPRKQSPNQAKAG
jgi:hypothetical protein